MPSTIQRFFFICILCTLSSLSWSGIHEWLNPIAFVSLEKEAKQARLYVNYPKLHESNCGVRLVSNHWLATDSFYSELNEQLTMQATLSIDDTFLKPVAMGSFGVVYPFTFDEWLYGTYVVIKPKYHSTFGEVFKLLGTESNISAVVTAVDCIHINEAQENF